MPIIERTDDSYFPRSGNRFYAVNAGECPVFPSTQALAKDIQEGNQGPFGCTIIGGQGMTDEPMVWLEFYCAGV